MKISAKAEYAALAMLQLAVNHDSDEPVRIRDIADAHGIPPRFLVQILLQLKAAGLVVSTRGASGGYQLARPPEETSLADVISAIEGPEPDMGDPLMRRSAGVHALRSAWAEVDAAQREILSAITLADLVERARGRAENMYYI